MCEKCVDLVTEYYSDLSEDERTELLMSATNFPFGTVEQIKEQLLELKEKTDGTLTGAVNFASEEFDRKWEETRADREQRLKDR